MREFVTAAKAADEEQPVPIEFQVDGHPMRAYPPTEGQIAVVMASLTDYTSDADKMAAIINFFVGVLDDDSHVTLVRRLMDRNDPFGFVELNEIMEWLMSEWSARPTKQPSDFTPSRQSAGRKSTGRVHSRGSTPSGSVPIASAT